MLKIVALILCISSSYYYAMEKEEKSPISLEVSHDQRTVEKRLQFLTAIFRKMLPQKATYPYSKAMLLTVLPHFNRLLHALQLTSATITNNGKGIGVVLLHQDTKDRSRVNYIIQGSLKNPLEKKDIPSTHKQVESLARHVYPDATKICLAGPIGYEIDTHLKDAGYEQTDYIYSCYDPKLFTGWEKAIVKTK
jgi:hypothetical protein